MNNLAFALSIANLALGLTLINTPIVKAATINDDFQVDIDLGNLLGDSFDGSFSFDDTSLANTDDEFIPLDSINFNFRGNNYTKVMTPITEVTFLDGNFLELGYFQTILSLLFQAFLILMKLLLFTILLMSERVRAMFYIQKQHQ